MEIKKQMKQNIFFTLCICLIFFSACKPEEKGRSKIINNIQNKKQKNIIKKPVPVFNEDSSYNYIKKQVEFGPRVISSDGWKKCGDFLVNHLNKYAYNVSIQSSQVTMYDGKKHVLKNIIASFSPKSTSNRIALFAHWDTRHIADADIKNRDKPIPGANDGGSGVGVLLEVARHLKNKPSNIGVDIILFDAEDYGQPDKTYSSKYESNVDGSLKYPIIPNSWCIGSQYWSHQAKKQSLNRKYRYGILLDMVGGKDAIFLQERYSMNKAPEIVKKVWDKGNQIGYANYFIYQTSPNNITDDHVYVNDIANIKTINIIENDNLHNESGFNKHWHTHKDNMNNISKET